MSGELFSGVRQWEFEQAGRKFRLPVFYYDNTSLTALHTAATGRVRALLPHPAMHPVEILPGRCLVAFTAFEYRRTDIGPYNEFSIAFLITFDRPQFPGLTALWQLARRRFGAYVWQLPVTTEIARYGGVELYGYPKYLADIVFEREAAWIGCRLSVQGQSICTLRAKVLPTAPGKVTTFVTYSLSAGIPITATVVVDPREYAQSGRRDAARLELGTEHPASRTLRSIGLSPNPVMVQYSPRTEAILFGGRNLIDR